MRICSAHLNIGDPITQGPIMSAKTVYAWMNMVEVNKCPGVYMNILWQNQVRLRDPSQLSSSETVANYADATAQCDMQLNTTKKCITFKSSHLSHAWPSHQLRCFRCHS